MGRKRISNDTTDGFRSRNLLQNPCRNRCRGNRRNPDSRAGAGDALLGNGYPDGDRAGHHIRFLNSLKLDEYRVSYFVHNSPSLTFSKGTIIFGVDWISLNVEAGSRNPLGYAAKLRGNQSINLVYS